MNLRLKLLLAGALVGLVGAGLGIASLWQGTDAIARSGQAEQQALRVQVERDARLAAVRDVLASRVAALKVMATQRGTIEALREFKQALATTGTAAPPTPDPAPAARATRPARAAAAAPPAAASAAAAASAPAPAAEALREDMLTWLREKYQPEAARHYLGTPADLSGAMAARSPAAALLQHAFIVRNPHGWQQRDQLVFPDEPTAYGQVHAVHHRALARARAQFQVDDWLLIDSDTDQVVYSVAKDLDFASNLVDGPAAASALAETYAKVRRARSADELALSELAPYLPAAGRQAMFAAMPVFDGDLQIGVLAWRLGPDAWARSVDPAPSTAAGDPAAPVDAFLVGPDKLLRTDPQAWRQDAKAYLAALGDTVPPPKAALATHRGSAVGLVPVDSPAVRAALQGERGVTRQDGPAGGTQLLAYAPIRLDLPGVTEPGWVLLTSLSLAPSAVPQALPSLLTGRAALGAAAALLLGAALMAAAAGWLLQPVRALQATVDRVGSGDLAARTQPQGHDELAAVARSVDRLLDERLAPLGQAAHENEALHQSVVTLLQTVFQLGARDLTARAEVGDDLIGTLAAAINQLGDDTARTLSEVRHIADQVRSACEFVNEQAVRVEETSQIERQALEGMASGLNQATYQLAQMAALSGNSAEAAEQAAQANDTALQAVEANVRGADLLRESITEAELRFKRLGERSQEVSTVVGLVQSVAERTHVLALNASMQAATAGEAGRGFALVAEEVQRLAESAREATGQIAQLVQGIQVETSDTLLTLNRLIAQAGRQAGLARQAGEQTVQARDTTAHLIDLARQIGEFSQAQSALADDLRGALDQLNRGSSHTAMAIEQQTVSAATLVEYARQLTESVDQFKLPNPPA